MTPARFGGLAEAYGSDVDRWPLTERVAARAYLAAHPEAADELAAQRRLDVALAMWTEPGAGTVLAGRIAATVASRHAYRRRLRLWLSGVGAAAALASGVAAGMSLVAFRSVDLNQSVGQLYQLNVLGAPLGVDAESATDGPY